MRAVRLRSVSFLLYGISTFVKNGEKGHARVNTKSETFSKIQHFLYRILTQLGSISRKIRGISSFNQRQRQRQQI